MSNNSRQHPNLDSSREAGFTLVELVLAIAIIVISLTTLLYLRMESMRRAIEYTQMREVQKLAQEKLFDCMYEFEPALAGDFEEQPKWSWEIEVIPISTNEEEILEVTILVKYPVGRDQEEEYRLSTWFRPYEEHPFLEAVYGEEDRINQ